MGKNDIIVNVTVVEGGKETAAAGTATLLLYVCDRRLMDAKATLVSQADVEVTTDGSNATVATLAVPDDLENLQQHNKTWSQMVEPSLYVSLDTSSTASTLTYADSPVFNIQPGATVELKLKRKK